MHSSQEKLGTLKWDGNGELSPHDVFMLVKQLKAHESESSSSQLLQLMNQHRHSA